MNRFQFITKQLLLSFLPFIIFGVVFTLINLFIFKDSWSESFRGSFFSFVLFIPILEIYQLYRAEKQAKKIGFDLWTQENPNKELSLSTVYTETKEKLIQKLKQGNWKYKIVDRKEVDTKTILRVKHYNLAVDHALFIELDDLTNGSTNITYRAKLDARYKFQLVFTTWSLQLKQIEYFQNVLLNQEKLNANLSLYD